VTGTEKGNATRTHLWFYSNIFVLPFTPFARHADTVYQMKNHSGARCYLVFHDREKRSGFAYCTGIFIIREYIDEFI
jgi:hypothetical protein